VIVIVIVKTDSPVVLSRRTDSAGVAEGKSNCCLYRVNFYVGDVCELVSHRNLYTPPQLYRDKSLCKSIGGALLQELL